jgi:hypothetical protein
MIATADQGQVVGCFLGGAVVEALARGFYREWWGH